MGRGFESLRGHPKAKNPEVNLLDSASGFSLYDVKRPEAELVRFGSASKKIDSDELCLITGLINVCGSVLNAVVAFYFEMLRRTR